MNSRNRTHFLQRTLAVLSATGTAALMTLPAFAQAAAPTEGVVNNGDANRNPGMMNNQMPSNNSGMMNNQMPSNTSGNCAPYTTGGVGGPIDSQANNTSSSTTQTSPSSYDTARTGVPNAAGSTMNQSANSSMMGQSSNQSMMGSTSYNTSNNSGMQSARVTRQFDGNNPSAAIAYRSNGPAGTSGHESKMNLDAFQDRQNSYPTAYNLNSPQASAPVPVACAPR